jgi:hypothetical protein
MNWKSFLICLAVSCATILGASTANAAQAPPAPHAVLLATLSGGALGSTIGPDGALYVAQPTLGRISRIDPRTGQVTTFASGLPKQLPLGVHFGGVMDVAFLGTTAYALVTMVSPDVPGGLGHDVDGIYRVDGPNRFTVVADIGTFNLRHPPTIAPTEIFIHSGVLFALHPYQGGFLVTDGHLDRVLDVSRAGAISVVLAFDDVTPTGLEVQGTRVYLAEAGQVPSKPHPLPSQVVTFEPKAPTATEVASGASNLVDVEFGPSHSLYALSNGIPLPNAQPGDPGQPNTGELVEANQDGTFTVITSGLDRPTSLDFIGPSAYVVTLTGQVWKIDHVSDIDHQG